MDDNIRLKVIAVGTSYGDLGRALSSKAHGGSIGIEVLFNKESQRRPKKFVNEGWF